MTTIARGEATEAELTRLIEKRSRKGEADPDEQEELWKMSVRAHHEAIRRENRAAWYGHHMNLAEVHASLAVEHERRALALLEEK